MRSDESRPDVLRNLRPFEMGGGGGQSKRESGLRAGTGGQQAPGPRGTVFRVPIHLRTYEVT